MKALTSEIVLNVNNETTLAEKLIAAGFRTQDLTEALDEAVSAQREALEVVRPFITKIEYHKRKIRINDLEALAIYIKQSI